LRYIQKGTALAVLATLTATSQVIAQTAPDETEQAQTTEQEKKAEFKKAKSEVFQLGRILVPAESADGGTSGQKISQSVVTPQEVYSTNRNTLDDALRTVPGVEVSTTGGRRNERLLYVRGFDRFQVPLSIDGIRVYLPADNRLDFGRFLTPDLSEIQVQKGYVSVLNGPGAMGGMVNLVTRKPTRELEAEFQSGIDLGNTGDLAAATAFASVGSRQEDFYVQASGAIRDSDGFFLSRSFVPTAVEGGGRRDLSEVDDWRLNFKAGYTPNDTDEYVISYTHQEGSRKAPYHVITPDTRHWTWPYWNVSSLSFYSHTQVGEASYVRTKAYYNTFENLLSSFDNNTFTTQTAGYAFDSYYDDNSYGFSVEGGTELIDRNTLKAALHYRRDTHHPQQHARPDHPTLAFLEPRLERSEDTWSAALENTFHVTDTLDFVGGVSYDWNDILKAQRYSSGAIQEYPVGGSSAANWQLAAIYRPTDALEFNASISSRTRFPNLFELYSTRFGTAEPNPNLKPERAIHYQLGATAEPSETARIGAALFYSDLTDVIQSIRIGAAPGGGDLTQNQNIGDGRYYGLELTGEWDILPELTIGANYTLLKRNLVDPVRPGLRPVDTPEHTARIYADWMPYENFTVSPDVELASWRWSDATGGGYVKTAGFALANINMQYDFSENMAVNFGVRNIFDKNYELNQGFPETGRTFFLKTRITF
jgi:iron complex outermembrane receptor protein